MTTTIRPATLSDLLHIRRCWDALVAEQKPAIPFEYPVLDDEERAIWTGNVAQALEADERSAHPFKCWLAETTEGQIVGMLAGEVFSRPCGKPHVYAAPHWFYIAPTHRGQGIGRALCRMAAAWLRTNHVTAIELTAIPGDMQWLTRGFLPTLVTFASDLDCVEQAFEAREAKSHAVNGHGEETQPLHQSDEETL